MCKLNKLHDLISVKLHLLHVEFTVAYRRWRWIMYHVHFKSTSSRSSMSASIVHWGDTSQVLAIGLLWSGHHQHDKKVAVSATSGLWPNLAQALAFAVDWLMLKSIHVKQYVHSIHVVLQEREHRGSVFRFAWLESSLEVHKRHSESWWNKLTSISIYHLYTHLHNWKWKM